MNVLFTVCGRGGSKGVKNKNIRPFLGTPLFAYTFKAIRLYIQHYQSEEERYDVVLSTDSEDFIRMTQSELGLIIRRRSADLAQDTTPKMPVIFDALQYVTEQTGRDYAYVIDLDITSPIRTVQDIRNAFEKKLARPDVDVVFSVVHARRNPYFNMVQQEGAFYKKALDSEYTARQQAPTLYDMNASIYVYNSAFLASGVKSPLSGKADAVLMRDTGVIDIDSEEDFELMEIVAEHLKKTNEGYGAIFSRRATEME